MCPTLPGHTQLRHTGVIRMGPRTDVAVAFRLVCFGGTCHLKDEGIGIRSGLRNKCTTIVGDMALTSLIKPNRS